MADFIDHIATDPALRHKLRSLGADTPRALLAQIDAAPTAFEGFLGHDQATAIIRQLEAIVPPAERFRGATTQPPGRLGVPLDRPPRGPPKPQFDVARRDELYARLQHLKQRGAPEAEIRRAEQQLDALLEAAGRGR